ncbi:ZmpA/ZmpB/ZmpC family metallo-endopeptidase-related protein [Heyndrickxia sporothermodurans]
MPILISTPQELDNIRKNLTGDYELANDIDMSNWGNFKPIGDTKNSFKGKIGGKGFKIKNLTINNYDGLSGLFAYINTATVIIKNLAIENCNINGGDSNWVGSIVGTFDKGTIENCYVTGQVAGQYMVGSIIGNFVSGTVKNCFANANVIGKGRVGGLIGYIGSSNCKVDNCYSIGQSISTEIGTSFPAGGLIGDNVSIPSVTNSFWDTQSSGVTISAGGIGKTTQEMKTQSTYTDWDFTKTWSIAGDYPYLQVFGVPIPPPKVITVGVTTYTLPINSNTPKTNKATKHTESILSPVFTIINRKTRTKRNVLTYTLPIDSDVFKSNRIVRSSTKNMTTFINPISTMVERRTKTKKNLLTYVKPLQAHTSVLIPVNNNVVNVYLAALENPSMVSYNENILQLNVIENPSLLEVIE